MDRESLKQYLSKPYQGAESFIENIIIPVFGEKRFNDEYETELLETNPELQTLADSTGIKSVKQIGTIYFEEPIQIFDITVSDRIQMQRNRVGIQQLIRRAMDTYSFSFMLFHYNDKKRWDWRFTFCHKLGSNNEGTDRKRYTFLLGPGQSCRTAADNFIEMFSKRNTLAMSDIEHAFSVEALSDEFFDKYKKHYEDILLYVTGKKYVKKNNKWVEESLGEPCEDIMQQFAIFSNPEKAVRDYVKKLMGRIVFLFFLQKKGWLGVPKDKKWGEGDQEFIQNLFAKCADKDHFVDKVLEVLFSDLNTERKDDISKLSTVNSQLSIIKVPYLNGGLFEPDAADKLSFPLPAKFLQNFLGFLAEYNFTIDENDPDDAEVGVDPEMLGRIFENLLEDNKDKGAYYTPKEIVAYMCRESLIAYLQTDIEDEPTRKNIRAFVMTHNADCLGAYREYIDEQLCKVKICDPAIGSGAFPMGLLKELFQCRSAIEGFEPHKAALIKKHIIQENIYGVDLERGAVDIARLRFWLTLVVDEETPHALPNLDFKIMQGNSLLEQYKGIDLSTLLPYKEIDEKIGVQATFFESEFGQEQKQLKELLENYYECHLINKKKELRNQISNIIKQQIHDRGIRVDFANIDLSNNDQFFLWHTWFYDVFEKGGFDIVIGNPPYVEAKKLKYIANTLKNIYDVYSGTADLSIYFVEHGIKILSEKGVLSYITTNKFFNTGYGKKMRELITSYKIQKIINFEQVEVFEDILVSSAIIEISKQNVNKGNWLTYERFYKLKKELFIPEFIKRLESFGKYLQDYLDEKEWSFSDLTELILKVKIENGSQPLADIEGISINRGVTTGYNPAFIINDERKRELINEDTRNADVIKNLLQGRNIRKWYYNESDENLIFTRRGIDIEKYPFIKKHLTQFYDSLKPKKTSEEEFGRKPGTYKWFEILDNTAYYREFERTEKIIWGLTADKWAFTLDSAQHYLPSNGYILTSIELPIKYILGLLNSKLMHYYFHFIGIMTAGGAYTLKAATISALPFKIANNTKEIAGIVERILIMKSKDHNVDVSGLESEIDLLVYHLYGLNYDEVLIVDPETPITREEYEKGIKLGDNKQMRVQPRSILPLEDEDDEVVEEADDVKSDSDEESEWHFVESVPFTKSSKYILNYNCRVVLSELGYYLEVDDEYIKLGDYPKGFNSKQGNVWIKKPINARGYRMVHEIQDRDFLIGYIREEEDIITFTNPDGEEYTITFNVDS